MKAIEEIGRFLHSLYSCKSVPWPTPTDIIRDSQILLEMIGRSGQMHIGPVVVLELQPGRPLSCNCGHFAVAVEGRPSLILPST